MLNDHGGEFFPSACPVLSLIPCQRVQRKLTVLCLAGVLLVDPQKSRTVRQNAKISSTDHATGRRPWKSSIPSFGGKAQVWALQRRLEGCRGLKFRSNLVRLALQKVRAQLRGGARLSRDRDTSIANAKRVSFASFSCSDT